MCSSQGIDPAAEGLANGDAAAGAPKAGAPGAPPVDLAQSFRSRGVQGSIAIGNLAELLESEDELTRFTAAKVQKVVKLGLAGHVSHHSAPCQWHSGIANT